MDVNTSLPYDDLNLVDVQSSDDLSVLYEETTILADENDDTYIPSENELYNSDTDSEYSDSDSDDSDTESDIFLGPTTEHIPLFKNFEDPDASVDHQSQGETEEMAESGNNFPIFCYIDQIEQLANMEPPKACTSCKTDSIHVKKTIRGSSLRLQWICDNGHVCGKWNSQPTLKNDVNLGDIELSSAIILSGNNYEKIELMGKFLHLPLVSQSAFYRFQSKLIIPKIDEAWNTQ